MKRSPLPRSTKQIARNVRPKAKRSGKRRVSVIRNEEYRRWIVAERRCIVCVKMGRDPMQQYLLCGRVEAAHTGKTNGRSSKAGDDTIVPLGKIHHDEMDGRLSTKITTKAQFAEKYGLDLEKEARTFYAAYLITTGALPPMDGLVKP